MSAKGASIAFLGDGRTGGNRCLPLGDQSGETPEVTKRRWVPSGRAT